MPIIGKAVRDAFEGSHLEGRDCDIWEIELTGDLVPDVIPEEKKPFKPPYDDPDEGYEDD